jgi:hypothetical protein
MLGCGKYTPDEYLMSLPWTLISGDITSPVMVLGGLEPVVLAVIVILLPAKVTDPRESL